MKETPRRGTLPGTIGPGFYARAIVREDATCLPIAEAHENGA